MGPITEEQRRKIEENRRKALEKRAAAMARAATSSVPTTSSTMSYSKPNPPGPGPAYRPTAPQNVPYVRPPAPPSAPPFVGKPFSGICVLVSRDRFMVNIGFHQQLNQIFRSIQGHKYDVNAKKWTFPVSMHSTLLTAVNPLRPNVVIGPLPAFILRVFRNIQDGSSRTIPAIDISKVDPELIQALLPFQLDGVRFGISKQGRCLISDDMGLGKSIQALGIAHYYVDEWPLLIVCPSSMRYAWRESIWKWLPLVNPGSVCVIEQARDNVENAKVLITSYDMLQKRSDEFMRCGVVIMDESHHLKNFKTARTKAAIPIMQNARRLILLSGTPALSRPIELYTQITAINKNLFSKLEDFGIRYCNGKKNTWGWDYTGSSNMEELQLFLEETVMIRRLKSEVLQQLPAKMRRVVILDHSLVRTKSNASLKKKADAFNSHAAKNMKALERRGKLLEYYAETAIAKLEAVTSYIKDQLENDRKFLCFAHHSSMMDGICDKLEEMKTRYIRIDGSTSSEDRQTAVDIFQTRTDVPVAVLSITAANSGITLTAANLVIFAELYWNPGILVQAEDRAHRIGQADSVAVEYLVAGGTADDVLWKMVKEKLEVLNKAGLSKDNFGDATTISMSQKNVLQQKQIDDYMCTQSSQELKELQNDPALLDQLLDESFS